MKLWDLYRGKDYRIKPTLDRIRASLDYMGNPQREFPSILVGGTNGKGSSCAFLESILREHGYKTGWFVSPHLIEENERWRINGVKIANDKLSRYIKELKEVFMKFELTYFEAATLIAMLYFRDEEVDVAVMEVGMGGRWDATKVSEAQVVGITNVERDHTRWLGKNVEEIAEDKLHLYREGVPLVLGSPRYPLYPKAVEMGVRDLVVSGIDFTYVGYSGEGKTILRDFVFDKIKVKWAELGLLGKWQADNSAFALVLSSLFCRLEEEKVLKALKDTRWEGRMEVLRKQPLLIVDGSHNPYSIAKVLKEAKKLFGDINVLFTGLLEKDWKLSMEIISRYFESIILTQVSHHRGEPLDNLYTYAKSLGFKNIRVIDTPSEAWLIDEDILAIGSLYLVGEIKETAHNTVI